MANFETLKDYNRVPVNLRKSQVEEVLPEYFVEDYPNLVTFLEGYYDYLDSDRQWGGITQELTTVRDYEDTTLKRLDLLLEEVGLGISQGQFSQPREVVKNFGNFFRVKGSEYSGYGFWRAFFDIEDVEITYPKERLFRPGISTIGVEDSWIIQDGGIYQIFSLLIRSPLPLADWEQLWRKYVHPSGYHLAAEVVLIGIDEMTYTTAQSIAEDPDIVVETFATPLFQSLHQEGEVTGLYPDNTNLAGYMQAGGVTHRSGYSAPYVHPGYATPGEVDADAARERLSVYKTPEDFGLTKTIRFIDSNYKSIDNLAGFHLKFDDTFVKFSDSSYTTFDMMYHVQYSDSDGPITLYNYYK